MTKKEIIDGLKFTVDMFLLDPNTGETYTEPRNDMDKTTVDACKGAIEFLEQEPCEDCVSRQAVLEGLVSIAKVKAKSDTQKSLMGRVMYLVEKLPSVTPQPKVGRWIEHFDQIGKWYECDQCHTDWGGSVNYCPNCGAIMKDK